MTTPKKYEQSAAGSLRQGEILSDIKLIKFQECTDVSGDTIDTIITTYKFAILLSQDCDLENDYCVRKKIEEHQELSDDDKQKLLPFLLFAPLTQAAAFRGRKDFKSDIWKRIKQNKDERYQVLSRIPPDEDAKSVGLPAFGMDFKKIFCVETKDLYYRITKKETLRRTFMNSPYFEQVSSRFFAYHSRIGLPPGGDHEITDEDLSEPPDTDEQQSA